MRIGHANFGTGQRRGIWPVLVVLLAAVLVPTACVLWFMNAAMQNERLAVRQKLTDVYRQKVQTDQNEITAFWSTRCTRTRSADARPADGPLLRSWALLLFKHLVEIGRADSVVALDSSGRAVYPQPPSAAEVAPAPNSPAWQEARRLEFEQADYDQAALAYARAAKDEGIQDSARAQAMLAEGRCLARAGKTQEALDVLLGGLSESHLQMARDAFGRNIWLDAQLYALQSMDRNDERFEPLARLLAQQVNNYGGPPIVLRSAIRGLNIPVGETLVGEALLTAPQRVFLMESLAEIQLEGVVFPTLAAERMASEYLAASQPPAKPLLVTQTAVPGIWQMGLANSEVVYLFREDKLVADLKAACKLDKPFVGITTQLELPGRRKPGKEPFLAVPASAHFPGWQLAVYVEEDPFAASAAKAESFYLAVGVSAIAVIALLAVAMASYLGRQIKLTRLKNDLIATVSHELKTPLASMRVLVDMLREGRCADPKQAGEYFDLIAKENERLSRLIDNFLTFSRMERNKHAFEFTPVDVADAVQTAVAAVGDRFSSAEARLDVDLPADLPQVWADRDAIVTVLLNLLDNAWKYSGDRKAVKVRACAADGSVCIEVSDNGVGMSRRAVTRIFDKFYQVDQTLSRKAGGCGLGLSIVKFILDAHGGTIDVKSQPGKGSTFAIRLPTADASTVRQAAR